MKERKKLSENRDQIILVSQTDTIQLSKRIIIFLQDLLALDVDAEYVFARLCQEAPLEEFLGLSIASFHDVSLIQDYLKLLTTLQKKGLPVNSILGLLNICNLQAEDFGGILAKYNDAHAIHTYLDFLLLMARSGAKDEILLDLLEKKDSEGNNFAMLLILHHTDAVFYYLQFLIKLYRCGIDTIEMIRLLSIRDSKGFTFGMLLTQKDATMVADYLEFLSLLNEENKVKEELAGLMSLEAKSPPGIVVGIMELIRQNQTMHLFYDAIQRGLLSSVTLKKIEKYQADVITYILAMENQFFKKIALRDALDPKQPLGIYLENYDLEIVRAEYKRIHSLDKQRWIKHDKQCSAKDRFFPPEIQREEQITDDYLEFKDPYEPYNLKI